MRAPFAALTISLMLAGFGVCASAQEPAPASQEQPDINGRWSATVTGPNSDSATSALNLKASGSQVTGTFTHPKGLDLEIQNGKLQGNQVSFDATAKVKGETYRLHYSGVIKSDSITLRGGVNGKQGGPELIFHRSTN